MAQRNVLQFIILGLIHEQPLTGYDLTKAFDNDIGEFWSAKHSQIYPQLKTLETKGLLTHTDEITGEKLTRKRYSITESGQHLLDQWLSAPTPEAHNGKDEFVLKLYFIQQQSDPRLRPMLVEQLMLHEQRLNHLTQQLTNKFPTGANATDFGHFLILTHAVRRERDYTAWLQDALHQL